jgi:hypothetical protein
VGLEPTISAGERPKTNALDGAATGTGIINAYYNYIINSSNNYYIPKKGFLEESDKEENVAVTGAATASYLKRKL